MRKKVNILLPVYNEEGNITEVYNAVKDVFHAIPAYEYDILFVDDGSTDRTIQVIKELSAQASNVFYISFSRNFGKDNALLAGLQQCKADVVITMDADLQHPPAMIAEMMRQWESGYEVVYTFRDEKNRYAGFRSQLSSRLFYKTINAISDVKLEPGISDFRLMDQKVVAAINNLHEDTPFFRGLIKWVGFRQTGLPYQPSSRHTGKTSYNFRKLLRLAMNGITSFSTKPLNIAIYLGFIFSFVSLLYIPYAVISKMNGDAISGWASVIVTISFFGGLQLMILGIAGIYLGKAFMQGKHRPQFIVRESNLKS